MAFDFLLPERGGTCAVIGSESCTYIPDARENITNLADPIRKAEAKIHDGNRVHGLYGDGWLGLIGTSWCKG